jgi:hypothetical protein
MNERLYVRLFESLLASGLSVATQIATLESLAEDLRHNEERRNSGKAVQVDMHV